MNSHKPSTRCNSAQIKGAARKAELPSWSPANPGHAELIACPPLLGPPRSVCLFHCRRIHAQDAVLVVSDFTPLHAHVQPGPLLPGTAPRKPHPDPPEPPLPGPEIMWTAEPGHLPSDSPETFLTRCTLRAGGARRIRNQMSGLPFPAGGTRSAVPRAPGRRPTDSGYHGNAEGQEAARGQRSR